MYRQALLLSGILAYTSPSWLECQTSAPKAWLSVGAGATGDPDLLLHVSAWYSPGRLAIGLRGSGASEVQWGAEHDYNEAAFLIGLRPRGEHSILVLATGISRETGWVGPRGGCSFGCSGPLRTRYSGYGPAAAIEWAATEGVYGLGLSAIGMAGKRSYAGLTASLLVGRLP